MKDYNILTQGDKVREIRIKFNFRQDEIAGGDITRNLISIIENNKASVTEATAKILANNINRLCKERSIDFYITEEYLMEDVISQAKKVVDEFIKEVQEVAALDELDELAFDVDLFLKHYPTEEKKAQLYFQVGLKYRKLHQYTKAIPYFIKTYESSIEKELTTRALQVLASSHIYLSRYDEALNYVRLVMDLDCDPLVQFRAKYNQALCYKKLNRFSEAFDILNSTLEQHKYILENDLEYLISVKMLMGSCLHEMKCFNKAVATYKELLNVCKEDKMKVCILSNLADVYREIKDTKHLQTTCNKILSIVNSELNLEDYEAYLYIDLAKNLRGLAPSNEVGISLLYKALDKYKNGVCTLYIDDVENMIIELLNHSIIEDNIEQIEVLKTDMFELIEKNLFPKTSKSALKFIQYYNVKGHVSKISSLVEYLAK